MLKIMSFGGGVQTVGMALMARDGVLEMPDLAIFADTGWEPRHVYDTIRALRPLLPFTIETVSIGRNLLQDIADGRQQNGLCANFTQTRFPCWPR